MSGVADEEKKDACSCMGFDHGQAANDSARARAARFKQLGCARESEGGCPQEEHPKATGTPVQSGGSALLRLGAKQDARCCGKHQNALWQAVACTAFDIRAKQQARRCA